jgi:membrane fusion protein (multidrug efflux system)
MDHHIDQQTQSSKPEWAQSRREREREALLAAGIEPRRFPWSLVVGVVVVGGIAAIAIPQFTNPGASAPTEVAAVDSAAVTRQILAIDVTTAETSTLTDTLKATGSLAPRRSLSITSQVSGTVNDVPVRVGDRVKAGDLLVSIDVQQSAIQLRQQRATAAATRAQLAQAENQLERTSSLAERGLTPSAALESERAGVEAMRANLEALEAGVAAAEIVIGNATVVAPFDGVVASRGVEPGQVVGAGAPLVDVVDLSVMEMTAYVPVSASPLVMPGQKVALSVEGLAGRRFDGVVEGISPVAVQGTRTVPVLVSVANADGALRGGMFATGQIVTAEMPDALSVPASAIRTDGEGEHVLVIAGGTLERRAVETVRTWTSGNRVELASGLATGETLVSGRLDDLEPGMNVTVQGN